MKLDWPDILIILSDLLICLAIGLYRYGSIKTLTQFAAGYKTISTTVLMVIIFGATVGAGSTIGHVEKIQLFGIVFITSQLINPISWFIAARVFAPNIKEFKGCITISQVMYKLYGAPGRWITSIASLILGVGIVAAQATAIGYVLHYFFDIEILYCMGLSYGALTLYSALGGIRAVVITEVFQLSILLLIIPITYAIALYDNDGLKKLVPLVNTLNWIPELSSNNLLLLASFVFYALIPEHDSPFIQRCLLAKDAIQLRTSLRNIAFLVLPFTLSICIIAFIVMSHSPGVPPSEAFLYYITNYVPIGAKGFIIAGIIAGIMSVTEAWLNSTSVILVNDVLKVILSTMNDRAQLRALRLGTLALSLFSIIIAKLSSDTSILNLMWLADNFCMSVILIPLSAGFLGFRTLTSSFIVSAITAIIFTIIGGLVVEEFSLVSLALGITGSAVGLFGTHYWQKSKQQSSGGIHTKLSLKRLILSQYKTIKRFVAYFICLPQKLYLVRTQVPKQKIKYYWFATFTMLYYFLYVLNLSKQPGHNYLLCMFITGYIMCFIIMMKEIIFDNTLLKKYLQAYWYISLTFCLPTVASYILLISQGDDFWIINSLISAFALYFFVNAIEFIIILSVGLVLGYILFSFSGLDIEPLQVYKSMGSIGYLYTFLLFTALVFAKGREKEQEEKIETMQMLGGAIAHEVRSPMATMSMSAQALTEVLGEALKTAQPRGDGYNVFVLSNEASDFIYTIYNGIQQTSKQGVYSIDSILASLRGTAVDEDKQVYKIGDKLKEVVKEYEAYNSKAKDVKIIVKDNFEVLCSPYHIKHIIFNLLKNAYKHGGSNVRIKVWVKDNKVHFKDYGRGIPGDVLPRIFERFYTKSRSGIGLGLAFCRTLMGELGGTIECKSKVGKYTRFILTFPEV